MVWIDGDWEWSTIYITNTIIIINKTRCKFFFPSGCRDGKLCACSNECTLQTPNANIRCVCESSYYVSVCVSDLSEWVKMCVCVSSQKKCVTLLYLFFHDLIVLYFGRITAGVAAATVVLSRPLVTTGAVSIVSVSFCLCMCVVCGRETRG